MNRTLKDATVRRYYYGSHDQLRRHFQLFVDAYNHVRRLKTLRGLTPLRVHLGIDTSTTTAAASSRTSSAPTTSSTG